MNKYSIQILKDAGEVGFINCTNETKQYGFTKQLGYDGIKAGRPRYSS